MNSEVEGTTFPPVRSRVRCPAAGYWNPSVPTTDVRDWTLRDFSEEWPYYRRFPCYTLHVNGDTVTRRGVEKVRQWVDPTSPTEKGQQSGLFTTDLFDWWLKRDQRGNVSPLRFRGFWGGTIKTTSVVPSLFDKKRRFWKLVRGVLVTLMNSGPKDRTSGTQTSTSLLYSHCTLTRVPPKFFLHWPVFGNRDCRVPEALENV